MSIVVVCPSCSHRSGAKEEWVGRSVRCPGCGQKVLIASEALPPQSAAEPRRAIPLQAAPVNDLSELLGAAAPLPTGYGGSLQPALPAKRRRKSSSNKTLFVVLGLCAGLGLLLLCGGIGLAMLLPAVRTARDAVVRKQLRDAANRGAPIPVVLAPPADSAPFEASPLTEPIWQPDPNLEPQLTTAVSFDRYACQLPAGFALARPPEKTDMSTAAAQTWFWASPPRADGSRNLLSFEMQTFKLKPQRFAGDLEAELSLRIRSIYCSRKDAQWKEEPLERGQLGGIQFVRGRYSGVVNGVPTHRICLIAMHHDRMLELHAICREPPESLEYQLLDAAVLTFRAQ